MEGEKTKDFRGPMTECSLTFCKGSANERNGGRKDKGFSRPHDRMRPTFHGNIGNRPDGEFFCQPSRGFCQPSGKSCQSSRDFCQRNRFFRQQTGFRQSPRPPHGGGSGHVVTHHAEFRQLLILRTRTAVVGIGIYADAAAWCEKTGHFYVARFHQAHQVF